MTKAEQVVNLVRNEIENGPAPSPTDENYSLADLQRAVRMMARLANIATAAPADVLAEANNLAQRCAANRALDKHCGSCRRGDLSEVLRRAIR